MFTDEKWMSAEQKYKVLRDWQGFIRNGFQYEDFSDALYQHLIRHASFIAHFNRHTFWQVYFNNTFGYFARFINQFGGDLRSAELAFDDWMESRTGSDLNAALISDMRLFFVQFIDILESSAIAAYDTEKWSALKELSTSDTDAETLKALAVLFEEIYPLDDVARHQRVTAAVRDKLRVAIKTQLADGRADSVFKAQTPRPASAQASVFTREKAPPFDRARLAKANAEDAASPFINPQEVSNEYFG